MSSVCVCVDFICFKTEGEGGRGVREGGRRDSSRENVWLVGGGAAETMRSC